MIKPSLECILKVAKLLYGVLEAGNYWFAMYHNYHINIFTMSKLTDNFCSLYKCELYDIVNYKPIIS